jgi:ankyrin repeat protein
MLAALNRRRDMLDLLIEEGAEVLEKDRHGRDAMWWAAAKGGREMTSTLEENKASPFISDMQGNTVFHAAASNGNHDVIRRYCGTTSADTLFNINAPNRDGDTPLILAARHGHLDVVRFLLSRKGKVQVDFLHENRLRQTALHEAGAYGHEDIYALDRGKRRRQRFHRGVADRLGRQPVHPGQIRQDGDGLRNSEKSLQHHHVASARLFNAPRLLKHAGETGARPSPCHAVSGIFQITP